MNRIPNPCMNQTISQGMICHRLGILSLVKTRWSHLNYEEICEKIPVRLHPLYLLDYYGKDFFFSFKKKPVELFNGVITIE